VVRRTEIDFAHLVNVYKRVDTRRECEEGLAEFEPDARAPDRCIEGDGADEKWTIALNKCSLVRK
jgi:hypothetical protein